MPQLVHESVALTEATTASTDTGVLEVEFITPGWGSSGYYSPTVVEAAAPLFAVGTHMYFDHPTDEELTSRPVRSVRDLAAVIIEAGHVDPTTGGVRGKVKPLKPYRELLTDENFTANVGVSIRGSASDIVVGEAEGRTGPIIEGLVDLASVDFVTRAGRGGSILGVLESARQADVHEATASDRHQQLQRAVRATYDGPSRWVYVRDHDADDRVVWFDISTDGPTETWQQTYDVGSNDVDITLTGEAIRVSALTTYVPATRPDSTNPTTESQEDTMPQIEESELTRLREDAGRVTALESERDTAVTERDQLRRERDQLAARESATTHARTRVTAANAALPASTVDRIVAEATRTVPLTESGQLDTAALDTSVDTARTTEETYLAGLAEAAGIGSVSGFGGTTAAQTTALTEADIDAAVGGTFGRKIGA